MRAQAKAYTHVTLFVTKHATIKQNGKKMIYYYVNSAKVRGWLWRGYLKFGQATPTIASMAPAVAKQFVAQANQYRAAKGMAPVSLDANRMTLLKSKADWSKPAATGLDINRAKYRTAAAKLGLPTDSYFMQTTETKAKSDLRNQKSVCQFAIDTFMIGEKSQPDYRESDVLKPTTRKIGLLVYADHGMARYLLITDYLGLN